MTDADRIAELEELVANLRHELGVQRDLDAICDLQTAFRLTAGQATVLSALRQRRGRVLTNNQVAELALGDDRGRPRDATYLRTIICRLRKRVGPDLIAHVGWGGDSSGYHLTPAGLDVVDQVVHRQSRAA